MGEIHPPTRREQIARCCSYLFIGVLGVFALIIPFQSVETSRTPGYLGWATVIWGLFLLTSLPAAVATLFGRWRVEYMMLPLFGSGLAVAIVSAWIYVARSGDLLTMPRTSIATALLCLLVVRILALHRVTKVAESWIPIAPSR